MQDDICATTLTNEHLYWIETKRISIPHHAIRTQHLKTLQFAAADMS